MFMVALMDDTVTVTVTVTMYTTMLAWPYLKHMFNFAGLLVHLTA